jgi:hypothetical protein
VGRGIYCRGIGRLPAQQDTKNRLVLLENKEL